MLTLLNFLPALTVGAAPLRLRWVPFLLADTDWRRVAVMVSTACLAGALLGLQFGALATYTHP